MGTASTAGQVIIVGRLWTTAIGDTHQPAAVSVTDKP